MYPLCLSQPQYLSLNRRVIKIISEHNNTLKLGYILGRKQSVYLRSMKYTADHAVRGSDEPKEDGVLL